ncbi:aspartate/glutamate racemase family protein [Aureibaculum sp. A20]|uniref:Aspartate/glutamate racemase family protein n=1 Tax=Aureibaculum flavum TaxID=2795986 RepID=A0ABS0WT90_9FLAO|nr:aspartate/glutamate racemase family protein [Aureibaculum flavum]MBJ2175165.1 aspartate/glutamate racemase family protein [Aureibaculum flavum]
MTETTLGILGLGSRSTSFYISQLNIFYNLKKGGYSTCPFVLLNTDFNTINTLLPYTSDALDTSVKQYITQLEQLNVEHLLIPNITLHETIDRLKITKNILHPIHLTISKLKKNKWDSIVLFGSIFSMKASYIKDHFKANGIEVLQPSEKDMLFIDEVRKEVYSEKETDNLIKKFHLIIKKYSENNPVVLGCTELSVLRPIGNEKLIDMAQVQMEEAVKLVL